jgi:hypothetical protein
MQIFFTITALAVVVWSLADSAARIMAHIDKLEQEREDIEAGKVYTVTWDYLPPLE